MRSGPTHSGAGTRRGERAYRQGGARRPPHGPALGGARSRTALLSDVAALARSQLFEDLVDQMPVYVGVWRLAEGEIDPRGLMLVAVNARVRGLLAEHQEIGMSMEELLHASVVGAAGPAIVRAIRDGVPVPVGARRWPRQDGTFLHLYAHVYPLAGGAAAYVAYEREGPG